jgi:hypothetical protein
LKLYQRIDLLNRRQQATDPEHAMLPGDRVTLYRAMLARASGPDGQPLRLGVTPYSRSRIACSRYPLKRSLVSPYDLRRWCAFAAVA